MAKGEAHYKNVLAQTDSMLTSLQASVETAEAEWRLKLEAANKELSEMRAQKSSPQPHINTNQMQEQLSDLQKKLAKEEEEKTSVAKLNKELDKEVENLSQQLSESRSALEEESGKVKELVMTNNSLKDLVTNTQEALDKEQNIVKSYKETTPNGKADVSTNSRKSDTSLGSARSSVSRKSVHHLQGQFYGAKLSGQSCPFPDEWTFATIPDSIADDEQVD